MPRVKFYTTAYAARRYGVSVQMIRRVCREQELGVRHSRDHILFDEDIAEMDRLEIGQASLARLKQRALTRAGVSR